MRSREDDAIAGRGNDMPSGATEETHRVAGSEVIVET